MLLTANTDALVGTAGADTFNSVLQGAGAAGTTIQAGDSINGGAGVDTLSVSVAGAIAGGVDYTLAAVSTNDVEKVLVSNFDTAADNNIVDTTLMTGLTTVGLSSSSATGDTVFSGMKNMVAAEMRNGAADLTLSYDGAQVVTGTADSQNLTVSNVTAGTFTANGIETLNITSELAKSTVAAVAFDALKKVTVSGSADLTITGALNFAANGTAAAPGAVVDASAFSGKLTMTTTANEVFDITGGSGADTFNLASLTKDDKLNAGDGNDTALITVHDAAGGALKLGELQISNLENFSVEATNAKDTSIDADGSTVSKIILVENNTTSKDAAVTKLAAGVSVEIQNNVDGQDAGVFTLSLKDESGSADALSVAVSGTSGQGAEKVESIVTSDIETINLSSGSVGSTAMLSTDSNVLTNMNVGNAATLNITGAANLTFENAITGTKLKTVDASAFTGKLSYVAAATDVKLTSGSGDDTLTMGTTLNNLDVIDGGAGSKDVLSATTTDLTATTGALNITNVETINLTNTGTQVINAAGIVGAKEIATLTNTTKTTITNLAAGIAVGLGLNDTDGDVDGTFDVALADATGTADSITFNFNDTAGANTNTVELLATGIETAVIEFTDATDTAIADANIDVDKLNVAKIVVSGAEADTTHTVTLNTLDTDTTVVDAVAYGGILTATAGADTATTFTLKGDRTHNITGSTKDDVFTLSGVTTNADATINGNGGNDVLNITLGDGAADFDSVTDIDTINITVDGSSDVTTEADGDVLLGLDAATRVVFTGGNSLSSVTLGKTGTATLTDTNGSVFDFSGYNGVLANAVWAIDDFDDGESTTDTIQVIGSASAEDKVTASYDADADATVAINMQAVETFDVALGDSAVQLVMDMAKVEGLKQINITDVSSEKLKLSKLAAGVIVDVTTTDATATEVEIALATVSGTEEQTVYVSAASADDNVKIVMKDVETLIVKGESAHQVDLELSGITMTATDARAAVKFIGTNDIELASLSATVNTIDASGMGVGGAVVQTGRSCHFSPYRVQSVFGI